MKLANSVWAWISKNWRYVLSALPGVAAVAVIIGVFIQYSKFKYEAAAVPEIYVSRVEFRTLPLPVARELSPVQGAISSGEELLSLLKQETLAIPKESLHAELKRSLDRLNKQYHEAIVPYIQPLTLTVVISNAGGRPFVVEDLRVLEKVPRGPTYGEGAWKDVTSTVKISPFPPLHVSATGDVTIKLQLPYNSQDFIKSQIRTISSSVPMGTHIASMDIHAKLSTGQTLRKKFSVSTSFHKGIRSVTGFVWGW